MKNLAAVRALTPNRDLKRVCSFLLGLEEGSVVDEVALAKALNLREEVVLFFLDSLAQCGALFRTTEEARVRPLPS